MKNPGELLFNISTKDMFQDILSHFFLSHEYNVSTQIRSRNLLNETRSSFIYYVKPRVEKYKVNGKKFLIEKTTY